MDQILHAYADVEEQDEEDARDNEATTVSERVARKRAAAPPERPEEEQQRRGRRRRHAALPDAGELLDGAAASPRPRGTAAAGAIGRPLAPPPPIPTLAAVPALRQQQPPLGPPLHDGNYPFLVYVPVPTEGPLAESLRALAAVAAEAVPGLEVLVPPPREAAAAAAAKKAAAPPPPLPAPATGPSATATEDGSPPPPPDVPLHISLTRAGTVRARQAGPLVAALGRHLSKKKNGASGALAPPGDAAAAITSIALLGRPRAFLNDDRTRSFLVLTALHPELPLRQAAAAAAAAAPPPCAPALLRAIAACDAALREPGLGLPAYYIGGQPHVSIASAPAEAHAALEAAAEGAVAEAVARMAAGGAAASALLALPPPRCVICQIGKRRHVVWSSVD